MKTNIRAFDRKFINLICTLDFLNEVITKYHFNKEQLQEIHFVAQEMQQCISRDKTAGWKDALYNLDGSEWGVCISLGESLDELEEKLTKEDLMLSYILEALSSELLLKSYEHWNKSIKARTRRDVKRYHFFGSEEGYDMEQIPVLLADLDIDVKVNQAFSLIPKKSVIFIAELANIGEKTKCEGICIGCKNDNCEYKYSK